MKTWLVCLAAVSGTACASPADQSLGPTVPTSQTSDADSYLSYLLADDILSSGEFRLAQQALGLERTCAFIRPAYNSAFNKLKPAWRDLYRKAIGTTPSPGALLAGGEVTMEQRQLLFAMGLAGGEMISKPSANIKELLGDEALTVGDDAIDYDAREQEMAEARAENRHDCGLFEGQRGIH